MRKMKLTNPEFQNKPAEGGIWETGNEIKKTGKINTANFSGDASEKENHENKTGLVDTREDSILNRPKTETYEKDTNENTGRLINEDNYTHAAEEEKRQNDNDQRKQKDNSPGGEAIK